MKATFSVGIVCWGGGMEEGFMQELVLELSLQGQVGCDQVGTSWRVRMVGGHSGAQMLRGMRYSG